MSVSALPEPSLDLSTAPALTVLLQHPCVATDGRVLLPLMASSNSIRAAALCVCRGRLELELVLAYPISKHGYQEHLRVQSAVASWLGRHGSLLAAFHCACMELPLLQALAAHCSGSLQRLSLHRITVLLLQLEARPAAQLEQGAALAQLTALTELKISMPAPSLLGAVGSLPQLRRLSADLSPHALLAVPVPPHLEQLHSCSTAEWTAQARAVEAAREDAEAGACFVMQLQHATALTSLACSGLELRPGDCLPPSLLALSVMDAPAQLLVQQARGLRRLDLSSTTAAAGDLAHLATQLTALSDVALTYRRDAMRAGDATRAVEAAAAGWSALPVRSLRLLLHSPLRSPLATLQHMGRLTGLTALHITDSATGVLGPADRVAAALQQMPGLQELRLVGEVITPAAGEGGAAAASGDGNGGFAGLLGSLGQLQQLRSLELSKLLAATPQPEAVPAAGAGSGAAYVAASEWLRSPAAAAALAAAPQALTHLHLWRCDWLSDDMLIEVAQGLQGLLDLRVEFMQQVTDSVLPVIVSRLQQLTRLSLIGTSVTDAGLSRLTGLQHLRLVDLPATCAPLLQR